MLLKTVFLLSHRSELADKLEASLEFIGMVRVTRVASMEEVSRLRNELHRAKHLAYVLVDWSFLSTAAPGMVSAATAMFSNPQGALPYLLVPEHQKSQADHFKHVAKAFRVIIETDDADEIMLALLRAEARQGDDPAQASDRSRPSLRTRTEDALPAIAPSRTPTNARTPVTGEFTGMGGRAQTEPESLASISAPPSTGSLIARGRELMESGQHEAAVRRFDQALEQTPNRARYRALRAWARYQATGNATECLAECYEIVEVSAAPAHTCALLIIGRVERALGRGDAAAEAYQRVLGSDHDTPEAKEALRQLTCRATSW